MNVQAFEGGKELQLKQGNNYQIEVPVQTKQPMELFAGTRDEMGNMNWKPIGQKLEVAENKEEPFVQNENFQEDNNDVDTPQSTIERKLMNPRRAGNMSAEEFLSYTGLALGETDDDYNTINNTESSEDQKNQKNRKKEKLYYKPVELGNLGWINIDAYIKDRNVADGFKIRFQKDLPDMFGTYVIFNNLNSSISSLNKISGEGAEVYLRNQLPIGEPVKMIIYTRKEDEIWHYKLDTVITKDLVIEPVFTKSKMADFQREVIN